MVSVGSVFVNKQINNKNENIIWNHVRAGFETFPYTVKKS